MSWANGGGKIVDGEKNWRGWETKGRAETVSPVPFISGEIKERKRKRKKPWVVESVELLKPDGPSLLACCPIHTCGSTWMVKTAEHRGFHQVCSSPSNSKTLRPSLCWILSLGCRSGEAHMLTKKHKWKSAFKVGATAEIMLGQNRFCYSRSRAAALLWLRENVHLKSTDRQEYCVPTLTK